MHADIAIIGGGILGTSLSYFLSHLNPGKRVVVIEQEPGVARHTSGRNTGKVHAPYLYNPEKKRIFARAAFAGFDMWREYARISGLPFKEDGVIEAALDEQGIRVLEKYMGWGRANGLTEEDIQLLDGGEARRREPEIRCSGAIFCSRDGSVDYGRLSNALKKDSEKAGTTFVLNSRATEARDTGEEILVSVNGSETVHAGFLINAAGGEAMDIAHQLGAARGLTDVHFRGEYWRAPDEYRGLTGASVYSVPEFPEYPFLDPHWIVRVDGGCEIGPNAVPVFSPYGYGGTENARMFVPKVLEMLGSGARKAVLDRRFQALVLKEITSSVSKTAMIKRVQRFLPRIDAGRFSERGFAGIRSPVINRDGGFEPDVILEKQERALSILNYNSPGASGALPFCAHIIDRLDAEGFLPYGRDMDSDRCGPWSFSEIIGAMS